MLAVAETYSFWDRPVPPSVPRTADLPAALEPSLCLVVQGVRRCGKSTLLQQLLERYRLNPKHCAFINLEDPRLVNHLEPALLEALVQEFRARHPRLKRPTFLLDEVQALPGWERWLRARLERPDGSRFVITGSNATLLSGELGSVLTGRHLTVELFPFDLAEARRFDPELSVEAFLEQGGFPEPVQVADRDRLLRQYFHDIVERDVRERVGARSSRSLRQLVQMVYESAGAEASLRRFAGAIGVAVETVASYLEACENAYLVFSVPFFAFSEKKRAHRNRKYYPVDPGLRRVVVTPTGRDLGKALECATHLELRRRFDAVSYWRDKGEVDFVVQDGQRIVPVQVTWDEPAERHHAALESFYEAFPRADEAVFVTRESFEDIDQLF